MKKKRQAENDTGRERPRSTTGPSMTGPETEFLKKAKIPHCKHGILAKYYIKSLQKHVALISM